ncbi:bifunctional UDP-N-acetylglucosamine diphosphorylase/glucosamine-1-phosphate N-acetyltransferase GlmU [Maledivibacter halophilus]|uniref:Bifunctional protein GlmU n=1 Tax=Maledivibacter halophilus TaxID=36842 RepID=A0A1T5MSN7_9FIRM|nr:bifunctional UDP-N-acetylglucosamine diphosphorylase/glucosamine-1-phosphate N-acetyltransferase GlmU [Maledivibacter halophilus]SKC91202.1 UDP-N-acetylglucosamine pyrophosphorylase /glucosamine-1-phosphate N-acetyltransferase [Maledivibacter halophilus]
MLISIVLAAGAGTRMKSKFPKVLHKVAGIPMIEHVLDVVEGVNSNKTVVVVGHGADQVKESIDHKNIKFVLQNQILGTGHAVMQAEKEIPEEGNVIVLYGDTPLIKENSIEEFIRFHIDNDFEASVLTTKIDDPKGYGRIIRNEIDQVIAIVEEKDANEEQRKLKEINSGIYCFKARELKNSLSKLNNNNNQGEYYITDVIEILNNENKKVGAFEIEDYTEIMGVNSRKQLSEAEIIMKSRILNKLMDEGVTIVDPNNTYVGKEVRIGRDTTLYPGTFIMGETEIGEDCIIGPNTRIESSKIRDNVEIKNSTILQSSIDSNTKVGPYAYLRPNSHIGKNVKIGDFVEVKNSTIGDNSKASHLSYIGDGEVGKNVNIGCGVVFVNYDGKNKHKTIVKDNAFIGCNVNLVAPVIVHKNAYVAAGSTITKEISEESLAVARARQSNIEGWVRRKGLVKE